MKPLHSILAAGLALAALATPAWAVTFQVVDDTSGSPVTNKITKHAGSETTLPVSKKSTAYISFGVGSSGIDSTAVTGARLVIYFPKVTKAGDLTLFANASGFTESFTTATIPTPTAGATIGSPFPVAVSDSKNFLTLDVTSQVISWLSGASSDFGFGISGDATVNVLIGSKEGSGSGYPAVLEVDVNDGSTAAVAGTTASFESFVGLDLSQTGNGTLDEGLTFGGPPEGGSKAGEGIASDRLGTSATPNKFGLDLYTDFIQRLSITNDGNVGIGTTAPSHELEVRGNIMMGTQNPSQLFTELGDTIYLGSGRKYLSNTLGVSLEGTNDWLNLMCHPLSAGVLFGSSGPTDTDPHSAPTPLMVIRSGGNVGIGTTAPNLKLEVRGNLLMGTQNPTEVFTQLNDTIYLGSGRKYLSNTLGLSLDGTNDWLNLMCHPFSAGILFGSSGPSDADPHSAPAPLMVIRSGGNVGIGTVTPGAKLEVNGDIKCIGAVDTSSDARYKMNIQPLTGALGQTLRLRGVSYDWNRATFPDKGFNDRRQIGFIAQEVREILPDVVSEDQDGYLSIAYTAIIPVLTEAVQELKQEKDAEIADLKAKNAEIAQKLTALEARDAARDARLTRLENALEERPVRPVTAALDWK